MIPASTSLINERLDHDIVSSLSPPTVISLPLPSSPHHIHREFQNFSESKLEILKSTSFENFENCTIPKSSIAHYISKQPITMEDDGDESGYLRSNAAMRAQVNQDIMDMNTLFNSIKAHLSDVTQQLSGDFRQVKLEHDQFRSEMRAEMDELRRALNEQPRLSVPSSSVVQQESLSTPVIQDQTFLSSSVPDPISTPLASLPATTPGVSPLLDAQSQMLAMLTESFTKLSTALTEKADPKSDWPKFAGDIKKFRSWYLAIMAQVSLPPWLEFYDASRNNIVSNTTNGTLNGKLYSRLLLALEGSALQSAVSKKYLRANGLLLLHDLVQTYKPKNVPEVIAHKTGEFWSNTKRYSNESIDAYFNRFHDLLDDLEDAEDPISTKSAIRHFIFTLGSEFEAIQNLYRIGSLPDNWKTEDWPTVLILCRDYYNSVKPFGSSKKEVSNPGAGGHNASFDRLSHQKKVRQWFMQPAKYCQEIQKEQLKYPDMCIFHLSKTHITDDCHVKKECDKNRTSKSSAGNGSSSGQTTNLPGQLRHLTETLEFEDAVDEVVSDSVDDSTINDTNQEVLNYFSRVTNHYLRLVNSCSPVERHSMKYPIIADSGANFHMFRDRRFFTSLTPAQGCVILGDGKTKLDIHGIGTVTCLIDGHRLVIENVRYVPDLGESIYSLFIHIQTPNHGLQSSFEDGLQLVFPDFHTNAVLGLNDIYLDAVPLSALQHDDGVQEPTDNFCRNLKQFTTEVTQETKYLDNLLKSLRNYYKDVKSRRQLNLEVPAGFRQDTRINKERRDYDSIQISASDTPDSDVFVDSFSSFLEGSSTTTPTPTTGQPISSVSQVPILRCVDKVSTSLPARLLFTEDSMRSSVGFRRIDTIKAHLHELYQPTVSIDNFPADAVLDTGNVATLHKVPRNTSPVPRPSAFLDVVHVDIVFGPEVSIGNVHYGLMFSDRYSRMTYIYPLQNLTSDICKQLEAFFAHVGSYPKRLISDFDTKLIGGKARDYLNSLKIHVNAAPSYRQDKNGLVERRWQTLIAMARNWLASSELPANFWFYAVKRAAEVSNYFPLQVDGNKWTTPLELAHGIKPDLRTLFKLFSLAAVRRERSNDMHLGKFEAQSVPMIAVGRCPNSTGLQFYNPANGTLVSSIDYKLQSHVSSGAYFNLKYQSGTFIYRLDESTTIFAPKFHLDALVHVNTHSPPPTATIVGIPTYSNPDVYTVLFKDGSISEYTSDMLSLTSTPSTKSTNLLPTWIKGGANATLFLDDMVKPRHGILKVDDDNQWFFYPGKSNTGIHLPDLAANCSTLLETAQLFKGHTKFRNVFDARNQRCLRTAVLRHVSAHGLSSLIAPTSLKSHSNLSPSDKQIWDEAYNEEYDGLVGLPTWEVISENQFKQLSKGRKALPTMAIATIKFDEFNRPKRAKYRLVVLGNFDQHTWSKEDTAAPVLSQMELRLLTSLAVFHKRVLKNCDVKQAFIQSSLPSNEDYFLRPPPGCPRSKPGQYWRLLRSLYGLKRAPKLWYNMLSAHLQAMGLTSSPNSPCLFKGILLPGGPPIYVGIYVDDIIYFSASDTVERIFEKKLSSIGSVDFMGQVSMFLGIEFSWVHHPDGNLTVHLTQQSFSETLIESLGFEHVGTSTYLSPYRSGLPIDSILHETMDPTARDALRLTYQSLVGSLNWLAHTTRPDLATVVSLLAQHQSCPSPGHLESARYVVKYLAHTKKLGIYFTSTKRSTLETFLHFPLPSNQLLSMSDANWGPQDASITQHSVELPLFASRSMSAFYVDILGPVHWLSRRQSITAASSAEAEIYATDECVRFLLDLSQLLDFLDVKDIFMPSTTTIYNDNRACVQWSKNTTSKGLRHIQMKENRIRENILSNFISIAHIDGKINIADIFTKEMKDVNHFVELRDLFMKSRPVL